MQRNWLNSPRLAGARFAIKAWRRRARNLLGARWPQLMRWMRSRRDLGRLRKADIVVVSFPKSGRTWLMVLLAGLIQKKFNVPQTETMAGNRLRSVNPAVPECLFTHGAFVNDMRPLAGESSPYFGKPIIFLARHPADTAISYYFQVRYRIDPLKLKVKRLPDLDGTSLFEFMENPSWGMPDIIDYLNAWAEALRQHPRHLLLRYEDLHAEPKPQLRRVAEFMGMDFEDAAYDEAIQFASFERLQQMERENFFGKSRLQARDPDNPDSFKVRRGKVGGYRDYLGDDEVAWVEQMIADRLDPTFGYARPANS